jgi:hypothetical protein
MVDFGIILKNGLITNFSWKSLQRREMQVSNQNIANPKLGGTEVESITCISCFFGLNTAECKGEWFWAL